jgi:chemosensory pili system protein ChpA (sensor histidine kinase/response regulator)
VQGEVETLQAIVERRAPPADAALLSVAAALIDVEDNLDGQLVRLILPDSARPAAAESEPGDEDFRHVQDAVLRECIVNMARIKEAISHAIGSPAEAQGLDQVPQLVRGITAGLLMLGRQRAVEVMEQLGRALGGIVRPDAGTLAMPRLERLADAIVSVEYYMEMLQAGRPEPVAMLDHAADSLAGVESAAGKIVSLRPRTEAETPSVAALAPPAPQAPQAPIPGAVEPPSAAAVEPPQAEAAVTASASAAPGAPAGAPPVDTEFVLLFAEEARENIARLESLFPQWEQNPLDAEALREVRRVFHTLKGSGRMVGAQRIGDFSWAIESLLNRVISQTLPRSPEVVAIVRESVDVLPRLVDELERPGSVVVAVDGLAGRADALSGREAVPAPAAAPPVAAPPAVASGSAPPAAFEDDTERRLAALAEASDASAMDPVLQDIFRKETAGHVAVVRAFLDRCAVARAPYAVTEALYRACHTLSGIAKTAGVRQGIKVAEPMERYVRKLFDNGHGLPAEGLALLRDTVRSLENVVEHVEEDTGFFPDHGRLIAGWHALERALDAELARLTEAAERTVAALGPASVEPPSGTTGFYGASTEPAPVVSAPPEPAATVEPAPPVEPVGAPAAGTGRDQTGTFAVLEPPLETDVTADLEPEFDADIAAIFSEEASELLEQSDASLLNWSRDRADRSQVTELKRLLHTLKGGARMAGIRAMGDLSHEMESFLAALELGHVASDQDAIVVLQASLDELHRMRDTVGAGQRIAPAGALVARLRAVAAASAHEAPVAQTIEAEARETQAEPAPSTLVEPSREEQFAEAAAGPAGLVPEFPPA